MENGREGRGQHWSRQGGSPGPGRLGDDGAQVHIGEDPPEQTTGRLVMEEGQCAIMVGIQSMPGAVLSP